MTGPWAGAHEISDMFDLKDFTLRDMTELGSSLRRLGDGARTMEEVASRVVRELYDHLIDRDTGERCCAMVRFFKTHPFCELDERLGNIAKGLLHGESLKPDTRCLTLLGTAGDNPAWNSRRESVDHQVIPLVSAEILSQAPMISSLLRQLGVEVQVLLKPNSRLLVDSEVSSFNVFYVPDAVNSPYIPAQADFVKPLGIRSVLGFGGMLPVGDIFTVILFSKVSIPPETAQLFRTLALNVKVATLPFQQAVFQSA